jgi:hypothetical protein
MTWEMMPVCEPPISRTSTWAATRLQRSSCIFSLLLPANTVTFPAYGCIRYRGPNSQRLDVSVIRDRVRFERSSPQSNAAALAEAPDLAGALV